MLTRVDGLEEPVERRAIARGHGRLPRKMISCGRSRFDARCHDDRALTPLGDRGVSVSLDGMARPRRGVPGGAIGEDQRGPERDSGPRIDALHDRGHIVAAGVEPGYGPAVLIE